MQTTSGQTYVSKICLADSCLGEFHSKASTAAISCAGSCWRVHPQYAPSDVALSAALQCLEQNSILPDQVDFVISCSATPDFNNPGLVSCLLAKLGAPEIGGLELKNLGAAPAYALDLAAAMVRSGQASMVLVSCVDLLARYFAAFDGVMGPGALNARSLWGDGGAACLVSAQPFKHSTAMTIGRSAFMACAPEMPALRCDRPSACAFPSRLTVDDFQAGRHLPVVELQELRAELRNGAAQLKLKLTEFAPRQLVSNGLIPGMLESLGADCECHDCFERYGYCGSAGPLIALGESLDSASVFEATVILGFAGGSNWGMVEIGPAQGVGR